MVLDMKLYAKVMLMQVQERSLMYQSIITGFSKDKRHQSLKEKFSVLINLA